MKTLTADELLRELHKMIDEKFKRTTRNVKIDPIRLKATITLWAIAGRFLEHEPGIVQLRLKELMEKGSIESNIDDAGTYPFDAYFIPKSEL